MATGTFLTAEKMAELSAGWEQVAEDQANLSGKVSLMDDDLASIGAGQQDLINVQIPAINQSLTDANIILNDLNEVQLPNLATDLAQAEADILAANAYASTLGDDVAANTLIVNELNDVTMPALEASMAANDAAVNTLLTVTLPDMQAALDADILALNNSLDTLNDTTLPGLTTDLATLDGRLDTLDTVTIPGLNSSLAANTASINTLNTVTIPGLNTTLSGHTSALNTLNTTTLPGLQSDLDAAEADVAALEGKFPVTGPDIAANAVTANKIAALTITAAQIAANTITAAKIAADTITANEIAASAITVNELAANAVTAAKILANTITANQIAADTITANEIAANAITASEIAANTITATEIAASAITASELAADAVTAVKILANTITAAKIAANTITANEIASNTITANEIAANAITASEIAADAITASKILAGSIQTGHIDVSGLNASVITVGTMSGDRIAVNTLNADRIVAASITGDKIAANTITATKLLVQGENLLTDPSWESGVLTNHQVLTGTEFLAENVSGSTARSGTRYLRITVNSAMPAPTTILRTGGSITNVTTSFHPKVSPGDVIRFGMWFLSTSTTTAQARLQLFIRAVADPTTNVASLTGSYVPLGVVGWQFVSVELTVSSGVTDPNLYAVGVLQAQGGVAGDLIRVDDMITRRRLDGSLIVDGTIVSAHMVANTISGAVIAAGTLNASKIVANSITANEIAANTITAGQIAALTITAAEIAASTITGAKIVANTITGTYLSATVSITSKEITGGTITGTKFRTAATGTRMEINDDEEAGSIKGKIDDGAVIAPVLINPKILGTGGSRRQVLYLSSGAMGGGVARLEVRSGSADNTSWAPQVVCDAELAINNTIRAHANLRMDSGQTVVYEGYVGGGVTGASVNDVGAFIRTSSSRAFKQKISTLSLKEARVVLDLEPVKFQWRPEQLMGDRFQAGFIAEQADQVGADLWVTKEGKGTPSGVRYGEITAAHNLIIKDQQYRIERLEALVRKLLRNSQNGSNHA